MDSLRSGWPNRLDTSEWVFPAATAGGSLRGCPGRPRLPAPRTGAIRTVGRVQDVGGIMRLVARGVAVALVLSGVAAVAVQAQQRADVERVRQRLIGSYRLISYIGYDQNGTA